MDIVILGAGGFVGSHLKKHFGENVCCVYKGDLDLFNYSAVRNFLQQKNNPTIINCITFGGKKQSHLTDLHLVRDNLSAFNSFYANRDIFKRYINIGSGAELQTNLTSYGVSKKAISDICETTDKFYSLRLYGCFGLGESSFRLFSSYLSGPDDFEFSLQDKLFDNISVQDFCLITDYFVKVSSPSFKSLDCVYKNKLSVFDQVKQLQKVTGKYRPIILSRGNDYVGSSDKLESLGLKLSGFDRGLTQYV